MILCFSGTGNSLAVARQLAEQLNDRIVNILPTDHPIDLGNESTIIWVFPIHSWGMPKFVKKYIKSGQFVNTTGSRHFMVCTCGDDVGLAHLQWRKALRKKGLSACSAHSVFMPNTYVLLPGFNVDSEEVATEKLAAMPERVKTIAHAIKCGSPIDDVHRGSCAWLKTIIIYPLFMRFLTSPKPFHADERCISCGKCVTDCPLDNIFLNAERHPQWGRNCTLCLGCYHVCPRNAVQYGKQSKNKGQWQQCLPKL